MSRVSIYLNFPNQTEKAFLFYKNVFKGEFAGQGIMRYKDIPPQEGTPPIPPEISNLIIHIELPILGGTVLMGSDAPEAMGFKLNKGNNIHINLEPDTRAETEALFKALSEDGTINQELQDMFWGGYFGSLTDKFGIQWMFNCVEK